MGRGSWASEGKENGQFEVGVLADAYCYIGNSHRGSRAISTGRRKYTMRGSGRSGKKGLLYTRSRTKKKNAAVGREEKRPILGKGEVLSISITKKEEKGGINQKNFFGLTHAKQEKQPLGPKEELLRRTDSL